MRKSLLAVAALMGVGVLPAEAARFRVDDNTFADFGYRSQIWAQHLGKQTDTPGDKAKTDFAINNAKIYFSGQVNKIVKFGVEFDAALGTGRDPVQGYTRIGDAHIRFDFVPEFSLIAGYQRLPFSRQTLSSSYAAIIPTGYAHGRVAGGAPVFASAAIGAAGVGGSGSRDAGLSVFSNIGKGTIIFRGGIFDGRYDSRAINQNDESLAFAARMQFTPTTLGYKGETGYSLSDTYLGRQNVLTLGVGYNTQKNKRRNSEHTWKMLTVDVQWEQKFDNLIPSMQAGYNDLKDFNPAKDDAMAMWVQGQLLFDQVAGIGKPAIALGYYISERKPAAGGPKPKVNRLALYFNYYIKGHDAKIQFGLDSISRNRADKGTTGKNFTDFTLALQTQF